MLRHLLVLVTIAGSLCTCGNGAPVPGTPGIIYTYPANGQIDVPTGAPIVLSFSDAIRVDRIAACESTVMDGTLCVVGPDGPIAFESRVIDSRDRIIEVDAELDDATDYQVFVNPLLLDDSTNLDAGSALFTFRTRRRRPHSSPPTVLTVNGRSPAELAAPPADAPPSFLDVSSIRVLFSEPMESSTVGYGSSVVLREADGSGDEIVDATIFAQGRHLTIDPSADLVADRRYALVLGDALTDLSGTQLEPIEIEFVAADTQGAGGRIPQILQVRRDGDPGPRNPRAAAERNTGSLNHPLIGSDTLAVAEGTLAVELGDPKALGGPIAFSIRRGQRLTMSGLDVELGGAIPAGLTTGDIEIHFLADVHGVLERNSYRPADTIPDHRRNPLHTEMILDVALTATDETGHAVLSQTVLGVAAIGVVTPDDGVLSIETIAAIELDLLGVGYVSTNLSLELITTEGPLPAPDSRGPELISTYPALLEGGFPVGDALVLLFDEPIDPLRSRPGIRLETSAGAPIETTLHVRGGAAVVQPTTELEADSDYVLYFDEVYDLFGNRFTDAFDELDIRTAPVASTDVPMLARTTHPGMPCALTEITESSAGRCSGGREDDDRFATFWLAANEIVDIVFHQPLDRASAVAGSSCGSGSMRVETTDSAGACTGVVPGSWVVGSRRLSFIPDRPWQVDQKYRLSLISGGDASCDSGEICGLLSGEAANFDPLAGAEGGEAGGPDLVIPFSGATATRSTFILAETFPFTDQNGSGFVDGGEREVDANRAALRITGVSGDVTRAEMQGPDCLPETPETEACMYLSGHMPVAMGELSTSCPLPDGSNAEQCIPVTVFPQKMFATSISMESEILGIGVGIDTDTGMVIMRVRESSPGEAPFGYIVDAGGSPRMIAKLQLYMDAPDMSILFSDHDLESKPVDVVLEGPMSFTEDGRFRINLTNVDAIEMTVNIDGPAGVEGAIDTEVPAGEMKLQLLSQPLRGAAR